MSETNGHSDDFFDFDLTPKTKRVRIDSKWYELREASAGAVVQYRNLISTKTYRDENDQLRSEGMADAEPYLISMCLFGPEIQGNEPITWPAVPVKTVKVWPNRIQRVLFDWIKENSEVDPPPTEEFCVRMIDIFNKHLAKLRKGKPAGTEEAAGNVPSATAVTSA